MKSLLALALAATVSAAVAADVRLAPPKDLDGYFPWSPPATKEAWDARAQAVREQLLVSLGLWPMPSKGPVAAEVFGMVDGGDYTVEKVILDAAPGFYVTGNLYRPKGTAAGKRPGVLCPHGHWPDGRFMDAGEAAAKKEVAAGAETFVEAARNPLQARCVHLARSGCVVFHYDMLGYADSVQLGMELAHKFAKQRPEMNASEGWGLFSPQAEGWLQSVMGLQAWSSIRALDFLESLPDVDPQRLACTGASGGGTQTFVLGAIDPRPAALFPAVMVSTAMQGGCTCENCSGLRVGTGNVEFAALAAPKPVGLTAADDWTKEMATKGFPQLKEHWTRLGAPDNVALFARLDFGHNYNGISRAAMVGWFNKHLRLGLIDDQLKEREFKRLTREDLTVWDADHPAPTGDNVGPTFERRLLRAWKDDAERQLERQPEALATGWRVILGRTLEETGTKFAWDGKAAAKTDAGDWTELRGPVVNATHGEEVSAVFLHPKNWNGSVAIWLDGQDAPSPEALAAVRSGEAVVLAKLFAPELNKNPLVKNPRQAPAYTYGYNHPLFAKRVHDVLTLVQFCRTNEAHPPKQVRIVAAGSGVPFALAAQFLAKHVLAAPQIADTDFRFAAVTDWTDAHLLPGALKYGDIPALRKLATEK